MLYSSQAFGQPGESEDRTLSPYFFVDSDNQDTDRLPLKSTLATVSISGVIADVIVTQVYKNDGKKPLEAIYIFPAFTKAAVYGMKMTAIIGFDKQKYLWLYVNHLKGSPHRLLYFPHNNQTKEDV